MWVRLAVYLPLLAVGLFLADQREYSPDTAAYCNYEQILSVDTVRDLTGKKWLHLDVVVLFFMDSTFVVDSLSIPYLPYRIACTAVDTLMMGAPRVPTLRQPGGSSS